MVNKHHLMAMQAAERQANMNQASKNAGIKFNTLGEIADYNAALREQNKTKEKVRKKRQYLQPRKGLPTGYDQ